MNRKLLIIGGDSQLGNSLRHEAERQGLDFDCTSRRKEPQHSRDIPLDLESITENTVIPGSFQAAIICAGITDLKYCEANREATRHINVEQTIRLAKCLGKQGCFVVFLSTNLVFDGNQPQVHPLDSPNPKTEYGFQKACVERELRSAKCRHAIVRLTKVALPNLAILQKWKTSLLAGQKIQPFMDYLCSLVSREQVVSGLIHLAGNERSGIWHVSGPDDISYAEMAQKFAAALRVDASLVSPVPARRAGYEGYLPSHTTLDASLTEKEMNFTFPSSGQVLEQMLIKAIEYSC